MITSGYTSCVSANEESINWPILVVVVAADTERYAGVRYSSSASLSMIWNITEETYRICAHASIQQWVVIHWEIYDPVVNCISMSSPLAIAITHELTTRSIVFVFTFPQSDLDVVFLVEIPLGMEAGTNIG